MYKKGIITRIPSRPSAKEKRIASAIVSKSSFNEFTVNAEIKIKILCTTIGIVGLL